jgi:hypothetical protein
VITTKEDIKTNDHLSKYGWELRIIQIEEDIVYLEKRKKEIVEIYEGICEKLSQSPEKEQKGGK